MLLFLFMFYQNFPMMPMRTIRITEPLSLEDNVVIEKSKYLFSFPQQRDFDELMSFNDFLKELNLIEDEYIQAIQCTNSFPKTKNSPYLEQQFLQGHASYVE